jgi:P27 family predicted phage terminase small subunit
MAKRAIKPTKLKVLEGNPGKRPLPTNEPEPKIAMPDMPDDLDADAQKVWNTLGPKLLRIGLLTDADGDAFAILCQIRSRLTQIHRIMHPTDGTQPALVQMKVTVDGSGQEHTELKPSPYTTMERLYYQLFRQYAAEFGLSPRGRVGLRTVGSSNDDDFGGLLDDA